MTATVQYKIHTFHFTRIQAAVPSQSAPSERNYRVDTAGPVLEINDLCLSVFPDLYIVFTAGMLQA